MSQSDPVRVPCPCCAKPVPITSRAMTADLLALALGLTPVQATTLRTVMGGRGQPVPTDAILLAIYRDDDNPPDGERQYATFKEKLSLLRPKLARVGLAIENLGRREGYRLVSLAGADREAA